MKKYKFDIMIIILLICVAVVSWTIINNRYLSKGNYVEIMIDGNVKKTLTLDKDIEYKIIEKDFVNIVKIEDGNVFMKDADCDDKLCVKQGKISKNGQSIICLPHKVIVKVISDIDSDIDAHTN